MMFSVEHYRVTNKSDSMGRLSSLKKIAFLGENRVAFGDHIFLWTFDRAGVRKRTKCIFFIQTTL